MRFLLGVVSARVTMVSLVALHLVAGEARLRDRAELPHDWVLAYYMSYDNDLAPNGPVILNALQEGVDGSRLVVTVLSDDTEKTGLKRYVITSGRCTKDVLATDDSTSVQVVTEYLCWVAEKYPAKHYGVVFLDHGGGLDQMCLDDWPAEGKDSAWLSAQLVGPAIREFRRKAPGQVDLLFLQQCGRASIENLYNFASASTTIMASQLPVGAPNTYYEPTLKWLAGNANATGRMLARQIMANDRHFSMYVSVDADALADLPTRLAPVIQVLLDESLGQPRAPMVLTPCFQYDAETNHDLLGWLGAAFRTNGQAKDSLNAFATWVRETLILDTAIHGEASSSSGLCGLSLFVPEAGEARGLYSDYPLYGKSRLADLWRLMYPPAAAQRR